MGQAKNRGTQAARQAEAIEAGRIKTSTAAAFHSAQPFTLPGQKPTLLEQLTTKANWNSQYGDSFSSKPVEPFHHLSAGAERFPAEIPEDTSPQGVMPS